VLEGKFRFVVDEAAGHDQVTGNPLRTLRLKGLDLVLRGAVKLLACDVLIDFGRAFPVRAVGTAQVTRVGDACRPVLLPVSSETAGTGVALARITAAGASIEAAGRAVLTVTERLPVVAVTEAAAFAVFPARAVSIGLVLPVAIRLPVAVAERLPVAVAERLPLSVTKVATLPITLTARSVTEGPVVPVTVLLAFSTAAESTATAIAFTARSVTEGTVVVTVTVRLPLTATETATLPVTFTAGTVTEGLAVTVTEGLPFATTEPAAITFTLRAGTVTKGLAVTVSERLPLPAAGCPLREVVVVAVTAGPEPARVPTGVVVSPERTAVVSAVTAVVLGHDGFLLL
jgi:hypothetical protein